MHHYFSGNPLDRAEAQRRDPNWLDSAPRDPQSRFLPFMKLQPLIDRSSAEPRLGWQGPEILDRLGWDAPSPILLGIRDGVAHFAIDVSSVGDPSGLGLAPDFRFEDARQVATSIPFEEGGIIAQAKAQVDWHTRHGHCPICGAETNPERGGLQRRCSRCNTEHFPRTDPVAIVLVHDGDRCMLGQSKLWGLRNSFYSCLSGFMDQGESIEEAVAREVSEEAGIEVADVQYHSSQPWPFPMSLMIGCLARAATTEIHYDPEEMNDVRWFTREEVRVALDGGNPELSLPGKMAIAHHLIQAWLNP